MEDIALQESAFETVTVDEWGEVVARRACTARRFVQALPGGVSLEMVAIPEGRHLMGSPPGWG